MSGAFAWLNDLMIWLGRWVPRLLLIPPTHRGVRFGPRGGARQVGPGLLVYWPITHVILQIPITTQSVQLSCQVLPDDSAASMIVPLVAICSTAIQFRVVDAVKAAIARHFNSSVLEWLALASADLEAELSAYGVKLERLDVTQGGSGIALKNLADWSYSDNSEGKHALTT